MQIEHYVTEDGRDPFQEYLDGMRDVRARSRILRRLDRIAQGNFGDHKCLMEGLSELRIDVGAGYRVYYTQVGQRTLVLLLCAGDKSTQRADIKKAATYREDYLKRMEAYNE